MSKLSRALSFVSVLASCAVVAGTTEDEDPRFIQVDAIADHVYSPDRAHLALELRAVTKSFATSTEMVDAAFAALKGAALSAGVAERDVGVQFRSMARHYEWRRETRVLRGNGCVQHVEVVVRDLPRMGELLEAISSIPNIELKGVVYRSSQESPAKREALLNATRVAREKAEAVATASGVRVLGLWSLVEQDTDVLDSSGMSYARSLVGNSLVQATTVETSDDSGVAPKIVRVTVRARFLIE